MAGLSQIRLRQAARAVCLDERRRIVDSRCDPRINFPPRRRAVRGTPDWAIEGNTRSMHDLTATLPHSDHNLFRSDVSRDCPAFKRRSRAAGCMTNGIPTCSRRSRGSKQRARRRPSLVGGGRKGAVGAALLGAPGNRRDARGEADTPRSLDDRPRCTNGVKAPQRSSFNGCAI